MNITDMEETYEKYLDDRATVDEILFLVACFNSPSIQPQVEAMVERHLETAPVFFELLFDVDLDEEALDIQQSIHQKIAAEKEEEEEKEEKEADKQRTGLPWRRIAAAAVIILCLSIGVYFAFHKQPAPSMAQVGQHDMAPGAKQATLTLANGKKIVLTQSLNGQLALQGNVSVSVSAGKELTYSNGKAQSADAKIEYNTLSTTNGQASPFPLVLSDGTKVWLNAASSIQFPTAFSGADRRVKITGEVYFEVAHNQLKPFEVECDGQDVKVLGTHFNINSYPDEPTIKTTLLKGSVRVSQTNSANYQLLMPGQQADLDKTGINVSQANTDAAVAWKSGYFYFDHANLKTVMRQFARWYDVKVSYEGNVPRKTFVGKVYRNVNASQALKILEFFNVHFKMEGKEITIIP